jgi:hypothetical protein
MGGQRVLESPEGASAPPKGPHSCLDRHHSGADCAFRFLFHLFGGPLGAPSHVLVPVRPHQTLEGGPHLKLRLSETQLRSAV